MTKQSGQYVEIDPAVADLIEEGEQRRAEARLPREQRKKLIKEREKIRERHKSGRATYDLDRDIKKRVEELAKKHGTTASQVAAVLLSYSLEAVSRGKVDFNDCKVPSESPRYEWNINVAQYKKKLAESQEKSP